MRTPAEWSLGGVTRFAKAHQLSAAKVRDKLESSLGYTLHKPTRRHGVRHGRSVGGGSHRGGQHRQSQIKSQRLGPGLQSLLPSQYQDGPRKSDRAGRGASVEEFVRQTFGIETP